MGLYERLLGTEQPKIPIHQFQATAAEWARGNMTALQANTIIQAVSGAPLSPSEQIEAQTLVATVPVGTTAAIKADRALRLIEIDQVLLLVDLGLPPYDTAVAIKTRLGV